MPWPSGSGGIKKLMEQAMRSKPVSSKHSLMASASVSASRVLISLDDGQHTI